MSSTNSVVSRHLAPTADHLARSRAFPMPRPTRDYLPAQPQPAVSAVSAADTDPELAKADALLAFLRMINRRQVR